MSFLMSSRIALYVSIPPRSSVIRYLPVSMQMRTFSVLDLIPPKSTVVATILNLEVISMLLIELIAAPVICAAGSVMSTLGRFVLWGFETLILRVSFLVFFCCCCTLTRVSRTAWSTFSTVGGASNFFSSVIIDCEIIILPIVTSSVIWIIATTTNT